MSMAIQCNVHDRHVFYCRISDRIVSVMEYSYQTAFTEDRLVVITTTNYVSVREWRMYLLKHFERLTRENSRVYVLGGIHGNKDGTIGPSDEKRKNESIKQLEIVKKKKNDEIREKNITLEHIDLGEYIVNNKIDEEKLCKAIEEPTLILLAYCFTHRSEVDQILRAAGVYAAPILIQEQASVTEGKYLILDETQKMIIKKFSRKENENLFIWGPSGSGKTLVATQVLDILVTQKRKYDEEVKIIIVSYAAVSDTAELLSDMKTRYLPGYQDVADYVTVTQLCENIGVNYDLFKPQHTIQRILDTLSEQSVRTVILIDEIRPCADSANIGDWSKSK